MDSEAFSLLKVARTLAGVRDQPAIAMGVVVSGFFSFPGMIKSDYNCPCAYQCNRISSPHGLAELQSNFVTDDD